MSDFSPSRRQVLAAVGSIGVGSAAVGAGTFAAFSDTATDDSSDNKLTTGSLDLQLGGNSAKGELTLGGSNIRPGDSGTEAATLHNAGSLDGTLSVTLTSITNSSTSSPDAEPSGGELADALQMRLWLEPTNDSDANTQIDGDADEYILQPDESTVTAANAGSSEKNRKTADTFYDTDGSPTSLTWDGASTGAGTPTLVADGNSAPSSGDFASYNVVFDWKLPEDASNLTDIDDINAVMGDRSTFSFEFGITGT